MHRPPIIALHGNLGTTSDWDFLVSDSVVAVDLWEHSQKSFPEMASMLSELGTEKPILLGYSLGGRLALNAFAQTQEPWSGAVIVSAHPGLGSSKERKTRCISDGKWASKVREMEWPDFLKEWDAQNVFQCDESPTRRNALDVGRERIALAFENWSLGVQPDLRDRVSQLTKPVLWVTGERDEKFTMLGAEMATLNPMVSHRIVADCGHRVLFEKPDELACLIDDFRDRLID